MDRLAVIADVHGNRWALEAVLEDIARRGVRDIVNAGDHLFGPLDRAGTADLLIACNFPSVAGNQDRELVESPSGLSLRHADWLAALPPTLALPGGILMFHGTPDRDHVYLTETVHPSGLVTLATDDQIAARLNGTAQPLLLCGHTHIPRLVRAGDSLIVNPGSVGLQAYADDQPVPHVMETGDPRARYAILDRTDRGWEVTHIAIPYDFASAAALAERNGRPDWAWRLRTGRAA